MATNEELSCFVARLALLETYQIKAGKTPGEAHTGAFSTGPTARKTLIANLLERIANAVRNESATVRVRVEGTEIVG